MKLTHDEKCANRAIIRRNAVLNLIWSLMVCFSILLATQTWGQDMKKADDLYRQGCFDSARTEYETALKSTPDDYQLFARLGFICFFKGEYPKAVEYFQRSSKLGYPQQKLMLAYTVLAHYNAKHYSEVVAVMTAMGGTISGVNIEQMRLLAKRTPYRIESRTDTTIIPFEQVDPLPVIPIKVNSSNLHVMIDTGADQLIIDSEFAEENGIHPVSKQIVKGFAGGKAGDVSYGMVDEVSLGDMTIRDVPVWILPTRRFSEGSVRTINGILGIRELMQFVPTLDYPGKRLVLRLKDSAKPTGTRGAQIAVPFIMDGLQSMYSQCSINNKGPVLMYFDSGLADDQGASLVLTGAALSDLGIPKPKITEQGIGGGGETKFGYVQIDSVAVSNMVQHKLKAQFQGIEGTLEAAAGYKSYGLLSHNFLKHYRWTIDFDNRLFLFDP